jgi:hypothetical protein
VEGGGGEGGVEDVFVDCVVGGGAPGLVEEGDDAVLVDVRWAIGLLGRKGRCTLSIVL